MASRASLLNVPEQDVALFKAEHFEKCWSMKWSAPLLWYACFRPEDKIERTHSDIGVSYPAYYASTASAIAALAEHKDTILGLLPYALREPYSNLYDAFSARLSTDFTQGVLLDVSQLFEITDFDPDMVASFTNEIEELAKLSSTGETSDLIEFAMTGAFDIGEEPAPQDQSTPEELALRWRLLLTGGPVGDHDWPSPPTEAEIALATQILANRETRRTPAQETKPASQKKPWWKFW